MINFIKAIELQIKLPVRKIGSESGTEFTNKLLKSFLVSKGIRHNFPARYTTQQNGLVERRNRTLAEAARSLLNFANLTLYFWAKAVAAACFAQNRRIICKHLNKNPYEGKQPQTQCLILSYFWMQMSCDQQQGSP